MKPALLAVPVLVLVLGGCGGPGDASDDPGDLDADVEADVDGDADAETDDEAVEPLNFIEVSVRIGAADDAELISLAADRSTLEWTDVDGVDDAEPTADCSGPALALEGAAETGVVDNGYEIRIEPPAVAVAEGGATGFELLVAGTFRVQEPVVARFVITTADDEFRVADGELILGEVINAGVFSGVDAEGIAIDGAFLCG